MNNDILNHNLIERVAMGDLLRRRARDSGDRMAMVDYPNGQRRETSYRDFNQRVNQLARGLRSKGMQQGDKLALFSANQRDLLTVLFACYKAGIVCVPINFHQNLDDIRYNLEHSESSAIVYEPQLENLVLDCSAGLAKINLTIAIGADAGKSNVALDLLIQNQTIDEVEDIIINDRDTAHMIYTSGTTSRPKAVETSHLALYMASLTGPLAIATPRFAPHLIILPMFHCAALALAYGTLQMSGTLVIHAAFDAVTVTNTIEEEKVDSMSLLPMMWRMLLMLPDIRDRDFTSFTTGIYGMAPIDADTLNQIRKIFGCKIHLGSGQTEFAPSACIFYDQSATELGEGNYWGVPVATVDQAVIDDQGNECPPGEIGEICWRGPQAMKGYYKNPEATAEASMFGWHHSGDLGLIDNEGQLLFVDRKKDIIKSGGENVSSTKVEQALLSLGGIEQAAVFGVPHPKWSEVVCACVQLAPGVELDEATAIAHCKQYLAGFEMPKRVIFVDNFPLTGTGKIRKVELRKTYAKLFT